MRLAQEHEDAIRVATTESVDPRYGELDLMSTLQIVSAMNAADAQVPAAVHEALPQISKAVDLISAGMKKGGRLIYAGAGTSGRLGVLDASECPPTFSLDPSTVVGVMAGGDYALRNSVESAEDSFDEGFKALKALDLGPHDTVVGIAASGRTPFVLGAVAAGLSAGATTVGLSNNAGTELSEATDVPIEVVVGPEILSGSTRLKSGTAQKLVLNMLTTATMVKLGKTYGNLMVDVAASNQKLLVRAKNLVTRITNCSDEVAQEALDAANGSVKVAVVMIERSLDAKTAEDLLEIHDGVLRNALEL